MPNDQYKYITWASLLVLFGGLLFVRSSLIYVLPGIGVINAYTYYKRLMVFPREQRWKAATPTLISIVLIFLMTAYFNYWAME